MKKKILALVLVLALAATGVVGASMAYLTDEAGEMSNVFAIGDVDIQLTEEVDVNGAGKVVEGNTDDNGDDTGASYTGVMPGDYLKKEVTVSNIGDNDAYVAVTVTVNNFDKIQAIVDAAGDDDANAEALLDEIFDGWGMTVQNRYVGEDKIKDMSYKIDNSEVVDENILHVDSAKRIFATDVAHFSIENWYKSAAETAADGYTVAGTENSFYLTDKEDYSLCYTYFIYLPVEQNVTIFEGLNVPAEFNNEQIEMFNGLKINVSAEAIQADNFAAAKAAFDTLMGVAADEWDGTVDTSWYNDTDTEFTLTTAEQLAGLAELVNGGNTFAGKTINLGVDMDLSGYNFTPIGGFDKNTAYFEGTFDGQEHTISGLTENGWDLGYSYGQQAGMGLFGLVYNATIKDVNIDNAEISMEAVVMGVVAGYATGDCTFENITVSNTQIANYNWDTGGIVGQVYGSENTFTFKDITIDKSTTISGHWGTWDVSAGGVIGRTADGVEVVMEDVTVASVLDVYNDVCAAYQWYAYRYSGMLVGYTKTTETVGNRTVATAPHVTCKNVTVIYDEWANYTYCQASNVAPQYVRVQGGYSTAPYYSGRRWTAGVDANGNKMVDDNHVHAEGEAHNELIVFDQLFGGGQGVYGTATHDGVTVVYNNK